MENLSFYEKHANLTRPPKVTYGTFLKKSKKLSHTLLRCAHFQKNPLFELFELLDAQNMCFGAWGRFCMFFYVQEFIDLFTVLAIFYKFWKMLHKSFSYEPSRQYGISPFSKTIIKKSI